MSPAAWEALAVQAPIVLIFAGALYILMRDQARNMRELTDKFISYMDRRDIAIIEKLQINTQAVQKHDEQAKIILQEARTHDQMTREKFKELGT